MQVNEIHFLSNMVNVLFILFVPIFTSSPGASYFEVGLYSGNLFSCNLTFFLYLLKTCGSYHLHTVLLGGFGFAITAFILQVFGFRGIPLGAAVLAILGFLFYKVFGNNSKADNR